MQMHLATIADYDTIIAFYDNVIERMANVEKYTCWQQVKYFIWEEAFSHMARRFLVGNLYKVVKDVILMLE